MLRSYIKIKESGFSYRIGRSIKLKNENNQSDNVHNNDEKLIYRYIKYICPHGDVNHSKKIHLHPNPLYQKVAQHLLPFRLKMKRYMCLITI